MKQNDKTCSCKYKIKRQHLTMNINISNTYVLLAAPPRLAITKISNKNSVVSTKLPKKEKSKNKNTVISKPRFWKKHNELQIVTLKNRDPDILDHLFQKKCYLFLFDMSLKPEGRTLCPGFCSERELSFLKEHFL